MLTVDHESHSQHGHHYTRDAIRPIRDIAELARTTMPLSEIASLAIDSFLTAKLRFALTAFGMVVGTASVILVVTIGLTGKQYILDQIQGIGANMVYAFYEGGGSASVSTSQADFLTVNDMRAVRAQVPGIQAASPMLQINDRLPIQGKERDILILGVDPEYRVVRNLLITHGRFFDEEDSQARNKVALVTPKFATKAFGSPMLAIGQTVKISGLPFVVVGVFKERVETFGQSEISDDTILIPYTVGRYFTDSDAVKQLFFSIADSGYVNQATEQIRRVIQSRHRPESTYRVENLTQLIAVAGRTANALTLVLLLISTVTLLVSGVGIMNIMLANVRSRTREIGIRKAVGATTREIRLQFLAEAMFISLGGGVIGIVLGLAAPIGIRLFSDFRVPISGLSVFVAIIVASSVGVLFGTMPATRAAEMDPVESLKYE
ncbi:MAG: ABC transporter permease [Acidobacteriales bacterium]|nr:ABC transporter permease [Terriglobales bacterium]